MTIPLSYVRRYSVILLDIAFEVVVNMTIQLVLNTVQRIRHNLITLRRLNTVTLNQSHHHRTNQTNESNSDTFRNHSSSPVKANDKEIKEKTATKEMSTAFIT
jgi:hypothetical protein